MTTLEDMLESEFVALGIESTNKERLIGLVNPLKIHHKPTYDHSIRVGLLCSKIARHMHIDPNALFYPGLTHDVGKLKISANILNKTDGLSAEDWAEIKKHPYYTHQILRGCFDFSSEVGGRHHQHQEGGYPDHLPESTIPFSKRTLLMRDFFSRIISLVDFYDSITTRVNNKFGEKRKLNEDEAKAIFLMKNLDQKYLIEDLYTNGIFGEKEVLSEADANSIKDSHDIIYNSIWTGWNGQRNPRETRRFISLACALEPLSDKVGCTTRETDLNRYQKLEYFIAGAINIGDAFEDLAKRISESRIQPELIYDLAYRAQADCKKNRSGGRVNQGIIEMLIPIVTAQMLYDPNYQSTPDEILKKAVDVMKNTTPSDVRELIKMKRLAYDLSGYHDRIVPDYPEAKNVFEYYSLDLQHSKKLTSVKHNEEFVLGFPSIKKIQDMIMLSKLRDFNGKVEEAYNNVRREDHFRVSAGLTADCTACGIYLVLSHHPKDKVVR